MKALTTYVIFILTVFTLQSYALKLSSPQSHFSNEFNPQKHFDGLRFTELYPAPAVQNQAKTIASIFAYYINDRAFTDYTYVLFSTADVDHHGFLSLEQYYDLMATQGISETDAQRVLRSVHGNSDISSVDIVDFQNAAEILLLESISIVTFGYIMAGPQHSAKDSIHISAIQSAFLEIFRNLGGQFPAPHCDELEFLFERVDADKDGRLNIQEFHTMLSIYLRYYKYGIKNNNFSMAMVNDKVFEGVWNNDKSLVIRKAFIRFLQIGAYDNLLYQIAHLLFLKFDADNNDGISRTELKLALRQLSFSTNQADTLFSSSNTNEDGEIEFAEFALIVETLVDELTADFAYTLIKSVNGQIELEDVIKVFEDAVISLHLRSVSYDTYKQLFDDQDTDEDGIIDRKEFEKLVATIIDHIRTTVPRHQEAKFDPLPEVPIEVNVPSSQSQGSNQLSIGDYEAPVHVPGGDISTEVITSVETIIKEIHSEECEEEEAHDSDHSDAHSDAHSDDEDCLDPEKVAETVSAVLEKQGITEEISKSLEEKIWETTADRLGSPKENHGEDESSDQSEEEEEECLIPEEIPKTIQSALEDMSDVTQEIADTIKEKIVKVGAESAVAEEISSEIGDVVKEKVVHVGVEAVLQREVSKVIEDVTGMTIENICQIVQQTTGLPMTPSELVSAVEQATQESNERDIIKTVQTMSSEEIINSILAAVEAEQPTPTPTSEPEVEVEQESSESESEVQQESTESESESESPDYKKIIETVEDITGLSGHEIVQDVRTATENVETENSEGQLEGVSHEDAVEALTETCTNEEISKAIEQVTGMTTEEIAEIVQDITGESIHSSLVTEAVKAWTGKTDTEEIVLAVLGMTNQQVVEAVAQAVLCQEALNEEIETVSERAKVVVDDVSKSTGLPVEEIVKDLEQSNEVEEVVEAIENLPEDQAAIVATQAVVDQEVSQVIEEDTGMTTEEVAQTVEETTNVEVTPQEIVEGLETATEGSTAEEVVSGVEEMSNEEVVEAITEVAEEEGNGVSVDERIQSLLELERGI